MIKKIAVIVLIIFAVTGCGPKEPEDPADRKYTTDYVRDFEEGIFKCEFTEWAQERDNTRAGRVKGEDDYIIGAVFIWEPGGDADTEHQVIYYFILQDGSVEVYEEYANWQPITDNSKGNFFDGTYRASCVQNE